MNLRGLSRGEQFVVRAGTALLVDLFFFPWHRVSELGVRRTGLQAPHALQGTLALLVTVAMVAQILLARSQSGVRANPALVRLQPVAGMAVLALLAWKLALETSYLSVGAYLGIPLAALVAYGGIIIAKETGRR